MSVVESDELRARDETAMAAVVVSGERRARRRGD